jgi:hypothetical protein
VTSGNGSFIVSWKNSRDRQTDLDEPISEEHLKMGVFAYLNYFSFVL